MPDILIRGVRTPVACSDCPSRVVSVCRWTDNAVDRYQYEKPSFCPLHELPLHGDLIDIRTVLEIVMQYVPDDDGSCSKANADLRELLDAIENAPVVVPAERRE